MALGFALLASLASAQGSAASRAQVVAPFTSEDDVVVAHLDVANLDTKQLVKQITTVVGQLDGNPGAAGQFEQVALRFDQLLRDVRCEHAFVVASWEDARTGRLNLIVQLRPESDTQRAALLLSTFFGAGPTEDSATEAGKHRKTVDVVQPIDNVIYCGTRERLARSQTNGTLAEIQTLERAFSDGVESSVIQVAILPGHWRRVLRELNPPLPAAFGVTAGELADAVAFARIDVIQQSGQSGLGYTVQATDQAGAKRLASAWQVARQQILTSAPQGNLKQLLDRIAPRVQGDRLVATLGDVASALASVNLDELPPRKAARRAVSMNNMKQLALAMHVFHDAWNSLPPAASYDDGGKPLLSWRVYLLPYLGEEALYKQFHLDEPWDSQHNKALIDKMPRVFLSRGLDDPRAGKTCYLVPVGPETAFAGPVGTPFRTIADGTSKTILIVEVAPEHAVTWTKPDDWPINPAAVLDWLTRPDGEPFLMSRCDGSVTAMGGKTSAQTILRMTTIQGGELVEESTSEPSR
jgi:hypothetical protein